LQALLQKTNKEWNFRRKPQVSNLPMQEFSIGLVRNSEQIHKMEQPHVQHDTDKWKRMQP